jgi:hypothetical protein
VVLSYHEIAIVIYLASEKHKSTRWHLSKTGKGAKLFPWYSVHIQNQRWSSEIQGDKKIHSKNHQQTAKLEYISSRIVVLKDNP